MQGSDKWVNEGRWEREGEDDGECVCAGMCVPVLLALGYIGKASLRRWHLGWVLNMLSKPATGSLGTVSEKLVMSQALQEVLCGQKSVNKE